MIESGLASSFASSLIILGCILSGPMILKVPPNSGLSTILWSSAFQLFSPRLYPWDYFKQVSEVTYALVLVAFILTMTSSSKHLFSIILLVCKCVWNSVIGHHNASNVRYPTLRTKSKAERKTNFTFYMHFSRLAGFQCFFILVSFSYIEVFNRDKNKKEKMVFRGFLAHAETEIPIKIIVCIIMT